MTLIQSQSGDNFLTFNEEEHYYTLNGEVVPGVTGFAKGGYPTSYQLQKWQVGQGAAYVAKILRRVWKHRLNRVSEAFVTELVKRAKGAGDKTAKAAASCGSAVHDYAYLWELGRTQEALDLLEGWLGHPDEKRVLNGVKKFDAWYADNADKLIGSEQICASVKYQFGGKYDRLADRNGMTVLSDFKTSSGIFVEHLIQLAAYSIALEEWNGIKVHALEVLCFNKTNGDFKTLLITKPSEINQLKKQAIRCRETYEFAKKWGADKRFAYRGANGNSNRTKKPSKLGVLEPNQ